MSKRINEDWKHFRDIVSGNTNRELKRLIDSGAITRLKPNGGKVNVTIPSIQTPHFLHGDARGGLGRGPGKEGDVIGQDPQKGKGKGNKAGDQPGEGIQISVDLQYVLKLMGENLKLPPMRPKPNQVYEEVKRRYNGVSKVGSESLRHNKRTIRETIKRMAMTGKMNEFHKAPGFDVPMRILAPIAQDKRYRQYTETKIPTSNAVIFFARDCSYSMSDFHCDIVSDLSWWIDCWIKQFYKRVSCCYFVHDTRAQEVDEETFYSYRYGGGTKCSSVFEAISEQLENRFPPHAHNIYIFYFTDGDNYGGDNEEVSKIISKNLGPNIVNLIGVTQVYPSQKNSNVKTYIDQCLSDGTLDPDYIRTTQISDDAEAKDGDDYDLNASLDAKKIKAIREILKERESYAYMD